ncbi:MAG: hypothetical protein KDB88_11055, partial [Flavobacteriales bacterium]|nr:hypothetical protein [Flavobacteriales bacterium]
MAPRKAPTPPLPEQLLGHALFLSLIVLSVMHWDLRTLQVDSAYQIYKWIVSPEVNVEAHRYSAILPQLLVKAMVAIGAATRAVLIAASVAHALVPYGVFLI